MIIDAASAAVSLVRKVATTESGKGASNLGRNLLTGFITSSIRDRLLGAPAGLVARSRRRVFSGCGFGAGTIERLLLRGRVTDVTAPLHRWRRTSPITPAYRSRFAAMRKAGLARLSEKALPKGSRLSLGRAKVAGPICWGTRRFDRINLPPSAQAFAALADVAPPYSWRNLV
jgi:hypothetical protein